MTASSTANDLWNVACHEAGHQACSETFGLGGASIATPSKGLCLSRPSGDLWTEAVISWGGIVGELLLCDRAFCVTVPEIKLTPATVRKWVADMEALHGGKIRVFDDWYGICHYQDRVASCSAALRILSRNLGYVKALAKVILDTAQKRQPTGDDDEQIRLFEEEQQHKARKKRFQEYERWAAELIANAVPQPRCGFPAPLSEFIRLNIADGGRIEQQHAKLFEEWADYEIMQTGNYFKGNFFDSRELWNFAARAYRTWLKNREKKESQLCTA